LLKNYQAKIHQRYSISNPHPEIFCETAESENCGFQLAKLEKSCKFLPISGGGLQWTRKESVPKERSRLENSRLNPDQNLAHGGKIGFLETSLQ